MQGLINSPTGLPLVRPAPACKACDLRQVARFVCVAARNSGVTQAPVDVLFVGEAPGPDENKSGISFSGPSGRLLDRFIQSKLAGMSYWISNAVRCFPGFRGKKIAKPVKHQMQACADYLDEEVTRLRPRLIVAMGNYAIAATTETPLSKCKVTAMAGVPLDSKWEGVRVVPMEHPAYFLRDLQQLDLWESRWNVVRQQLDLEAAVHQTVDWEYLESVEMIVKRLGEVVSRGRRVAVDIETTGLEYASDAILMIGVADRVDRGFTFPVTNVRVATALLQLFESGQTVVMHNATFDLNFLAHHYGIVATGRVDCTKALSYLHNERHPRNLRDLVSTYVPEYHGFKKATEESGLDWIDMPVQMLAERCAIDCCATLALSDKLRATLLPQRVRMYDSIIAPALHQLVEMRQQGIAVDRREMVRIITEGRARCDLLEEEVLYHVPEGKDGTFTVGGNRDRSDLLDWLGLADVITERTDSGEMISTKADVLEKYVDVHPVVRPLMEYSTLTRTVNQFYVPAMGYSERDGKLHPGWSWGGRAYAGEASGTPTGRLTTAAPNLMNPPEEFRRVVVTKFEGGQIVGADYAQQELRVVVSLAHETAMIERMAEGADPHGVTAELTGQPREVAKRINFGILFGAGVEKLMTLGLSRQEAIDALRRADEAFPGVPVWKADLKTEMLNTGRVEGVWGQALHVPDIYSSRWGEQVHAANRGINFKVSNAGAIMTIVAMQLIREQFRARRMRSHVFTQLYDYIGCDCPGDEADEVERIMHDCMVDKMHEICGEWLKVPLAVDFKRGRSMAGSQMKGTAR